MSFALQYRKKLQAQQSKEQAVKKANEGFVSMPADASTDTTRNRRQVLLALVLAGAILGVFNSGGLVSYMQGLANTPAGPHLILASEKWHELMQQKQATRVVDHIRGSVTFVRQASWQDLTLGLALATAEKKIEPVPGQVVPVKIPAVPEREELIEPEITKPSGPIMRAAVGKLP